VLAAKLSPWRIIYLGIGALCFAVTLLFLPLSSPFIAFALFMVGLGNGPVFPNLTHLTPINFGKEISGSVMGSQMAAAYIGIMIFPPLYGIMAEKISAGVFPLYLAFFLAAMIFAMALLVKGLKKEREKI
jgi:MFS family permease